MPHSVGKLNPRDGRRGGRPQADRSPCGSRARVLMHVREADLATRTIGRGGPGKSERASLPLYVMARMFSTEAKATNGSSR